jgi:phosphopantetheine adenylyltransferase
MLQTMYPGRVVVPENKIEVVSYSGLTAQYAQARGVSFILRGIRDPADLAYELQQSTVNRVVGSIDTVFLLTQIQNAFVSSGYIRQVVQLGCRELARLKVWLPEAVAVKVLERIPEIGSPGSFLQQFQEKVAPDTSQHAGAKTMVLSATREGRGSD